MGDLCNARNPHEPAVRCEWLRGHSGDHGRNGMTWVRGEHGMAECRSWGGNNCYCAFEPGHAGRHWCGNARCGDSPLRHYWSDPAPTWVPVERADLRDGNEVRLVTQGRWAGGFIVSAETHYERLTPSTTGEQP